MPGNNKDTIPSSNVTPFKDGVPYNEVATQKSFFERFNFMNAISKNKSD